MATGSDEEVAAFEAETRIRPEPIDGYEIQKQWVPPKSDDWYRFVDFYSSNLDTPLPENSYHEDAAWSLHLDVIERRADQYDWYWSHHLPVWSEEVFRRFGHRMLAAGADEHLWLVIQLGKLPMSRDLFEKTEFFWMPKHYDLLASAFDFDIAELGVEQIDELLKKCAIYPLGFCESTDPVERR